MRGERPGGGYARGLAAGTPDGIEAARLDFNACAEVAVGIAARRERLIV
ncbi:MULTISPECIES: hypothetical protein [Bradyrhizobium]|nr:MULTISPECIES: hypothetical protein [Bradyrhizobium]UQR60196.1 hypothetical protein LRP30_24525 [Bradyrhizobium sp. C-145]